MGYADLKLRIADTVQIVYLKYDLDDHDAACRKAGTIVKSSITPTWKPVYQSASGDQPSLFACSICCTWR